MASDFFGRQRECHFYTAGCGNKMVSVTGPRAVNELGGPVIPGTMHTLLTIILKPLNVRALFLAYRLIYI